MASRRLVALIALAGCAAAPPRPAAPAPATSTTPAAPPAPAAQAAPAAPPSTSSAQASAPAPARPPDPSIQPEIDPVSSPVVVPAPPTFDLPAAEPGFTSFRELRVHGRAHFGEQVKVKAYVISIYDCISDLMRDGQPRAQVQASIDLHPEQCVRPRIRIAPRADGSDLDAISVVEIARPPNRAERTNLPRAELAAWPKVPVYALGDAIVVTGTWTDRSPHGDADSDGLIVYAGIERVTP